MVEVVAVVVVVVAGVVVVVVVRASDAPLVRACSVASAAWARLGAPS